MGASSARRGSRPRAEVRSQPSSYPARDRRAQRDLAQAEVSLAGRALSSGRRLMDERRPRSAVVVEDGAKLVRERFGLAGVSLLAAEEASVVTREDGHRLTEQRGGRDGRTSGEPVTRLLADRDDDPSRRRDQRLD